MSPAAKRTAVILSIGLVAALLWMLLVEVSRPGFDRDAWVAARGDERGPDHPRAAMVAAVMERLRVGMSKADVEALLGPGDGGSEDQRLRYGVGVSGFGVDYDSLVIEFGDNGRVAQFWIEQG